MFFCFFKWNLTSSLMKFELLLATSYIQRWDFFLKRLDKHFTKQSVHNCSIQNLNFWQNIGIAGTGAGQLRPISRCCLRPTICLLCQLGGHRTSLMIPCIQISSGKKFKYSNVQISTYSTIMLIQGLHQQKRIHMATERLVYLLELIAKHSLDQNPAKIYFTMTQWGDISFKIFPFFKYVICVSWNFISEKKWRGISSTSVLFLSLPTPHSITSIVSSPTLFVTFALIENEEMSPLSIKHS